LARACGVGQTTAPPLPSKRFWAGKAVLNWGPGPAATGPEPLVRRLFGWRCRPGQPAPPPLANARRRRCHQPATPCPACSRWLPLPSVDHWGRNRRAQQAVQLAIAGPGARCAEPAIRLVQPAWPFQPAWPSTHGPQQALPGWPRGLPARRLPASKHPSAFWFGQGGRYGAAEECHPSLIARCQGPANAMGRSPGRHPSLKQPQPAATLAHRAHSHGSSIRFPLQR